MTGAMSCGETAHDDDNHRCTAMSRSPGLAGLVSDMINVKFRSELLSLLSLPHTHTLSMTWQQTPTTDIFIQKYASEEEFFPRKTFKCILKYEH